MNVLSSLFKTSILMWRLNIDICINVYFLSTLLLTAVSLLGAHLVWEEMVSACWCGLLAALSLLLDAR